MKIFTKSIICSMLSILPSLSQAETPLVLAAEAGKLAIVKSLVESGGNVNEVDTDSTWETTPLLAAASNGHTMVVEYLLSKGADTKVVSAAGASALRKAVQGGHAKVVEVLLKAKVDPENDTDSSLRSPLIWALFSSRDGNKEDYVKIINLLHDAGAMCRKYFLSPFDDSEIAVTKSISEYDPAVQEAYKKACPD